jgi:hypothetical protein
MDELDPRVAALIELGRDAHDPTPEDDASVHGATPMMPKKCDPELA